MAEVHKTSADGSFFVNVTAGWAVYKSAGTRSPLASVRNSRQGRNKPRREGGAVEQGREGIEDFMRRKLRLYEGNRVVRAPAVAVAIRLLPSLRDEEGEIHMARRRTL